jgi:hypothetical protein
MGKTSGVFFTSVPTRLEAKDEKSLIKTFPSLDNHPDHHFQRMRSRSDRCQRADP